MTKDYTELHEYIQEIKDLQKEKKRIRNRINFLLSLCDDIMNRHPLPGTAKEELEKMKAAEALGSTKLDEIWNRR